MEYKPGNKPDKVKHKALENLVDLILPSTYVEFHSGPGRYNGYDGSSVRTLNILKGRGIDSTVYLHEKDDGLRQQLIANTLGFKSDKQEIFVGGEWENSQENYLNADHSWLFLLDPTKIKSYNKYSINFLDKTLSTGANFLLYMPQGLFKSKQQQKARRGHRKKVKEIKDLIGKYQRNYLDRFIFAGRGNLKRKDHIVIVSELIPDLKACFKKYISN